MRSSFELTIADASLAGDRLVACLSDGRIIVYPLTGMTWITEAPQEQQSDFTVTDWEIYWNQLDDGLTLEHILSLKPRVNFAVEPPPDWEAFREVLAKQRVVVHGTPEVS